MNTGAKIVMWSVVLLLFACGEKTSQELSDDIENRIEKLLAQMTLEEKAGQMTQIGIPAICVQNGYWDNVDSLIIDTAKLRNIVEKHHVGSFLGKGFYPPTAQEYYRLISQIQDFAVNQTRLGIPVLYGTDAVHGANYTAGSTIFPHQLALAATWNPQLAKTMGKITSYELRASNTPLNFAPVVDISWQGQWGRIFETFGEDPLLTAKMSAAFIRGSQGDDLSDSTKTAVCLKHLIGYGSPQYGQDRKNAFIPERYLRQYYLPPFEAAIQAGAKVVMISSGLVNGIPCHTNRFLITDLLKGELNFQGFTISDWGDMQFLTELHKTAPNAKDAVRQMVNAGLDMCMVPYDVSFAQHVIELVNEGEIPQSRIDDAVRRILRVKMQLGLFEEPNTHYKDYQEFGSSQFAEKSYNAAAEALTLLKNEGILPLKSDKKVLITGVAAHSLNYLNGPWSRSWSGQETEYNDTDKLTIYDAVEKIVGTNNVEYVAGTDFDTDINTEKAVAAARKSDYVVVCLGEIPLAERPGDIYELYLPVAQRRLVKELHKSGKPIIVVLLEGRGRIISDIVDLADGILMGYYPGNEGGRAIADVLYGQINPSGKLPFTYQKYAATPMPYLHTVTDRDDNRGGYTAYDPQWPFGFGLSYTTFQYDSIWTDRSEFTAIDSLNVFVKIKNIGETNGAEVVQLYLRDDFASIDPDFERLVAFEKVKLQKAADTTLNFRLNYKDFTFINAFNQRVAEAGSFTLTTGNRNGIVKQTRVQLIEKQ